MTLMGRGPRVAIGVIALTAPLYLAACDQAPAQDGALDYVMVCTTATAQPTRLPDDACREIGPTGRTEGGGVWRNAALPASPQREYVDTCTDEDGYGYECSAMAPDTDDGGVGIPPVGGLIFWPGGPAWGYGSAPVSALDRTGRGAGVGGGTFTRSGAGTAGFGSAGSRISARTPVVRQPSPFISRGGLGASSSASKGGSSGS